MSLRTIKAGAVDQTIDVPLKDSSSPVGGGLTGLVFNSAGLTCYYRKGATGASTALTLATLAAVTSVHSDGGFKEIDATNMPGMYRLDLSDAMVADAGMLTIFIQGAANLVPCEIQIEVSGDHSVMTAAELFAALFDAANTSTNDPTKFGGQVRRTHARVGGTKQKQDRNVANAPVVSQNEADSAALVTVTPTVPSAGVTHWTPS